MGKYSDDEEENNSMLNINIEKEKEKKEPKVATWQYCLMLALAIGIKSWQPLAIAASKNDDGSYSWNKTTMVILVEFVKLVFCAIVFSVQYYRTEPKLRPLLHALSFDQSLHFLVPAVLYAASNTLVYIGMSYINPALFHVFGNTRILTAGILYRIMMGKTQSDTQWLALVLLTSGAILATPAGEAEPKEGENNFLGLVILILMCLCSTSSSIYTEINYKKTQELSIFYQNCVLYIYGIMVNGLFLVYTDAEQISQDGMFYGFDWPAFWVLIAQSSMGVSLSFIFKYLDNIVYVIALTISMFISAVFSMIFFEFEFTISFACALIVVTIAIYHYYRTKIFEKYDLTDKDMFF
jgi:UDP-galactose transporter